MKPYAPLCFLFLLLFASCEPVLVEKDRPVHWTNVPKRKDSHAPIYVNLPAQGDTLEFIGDYAELHLDRAQKYYSDYDTIIEHPFWVPDSPPSDTAIRKNITIILTRNKARNTTTLKIMAKPNNTSKKISFTLNVEIFPMFTDPFVITQEPMTSTEGKQ